MMAHGLLNFGLPLFSLNQIEQWTSVKGAPCYYPLDASPLSTCTEQLFTAPTQLPIIIDPISFPALRYSRTRTANTSHVSNSRYVRWTCGEANVNRYHLNRSGCIDMLLKDVDRLLSIKNNQRSEVNKRSRMESGRKAPPKNTKMLIRLSFLVDSPDGTLLVAGTFD